MTHPVLIRELIAASIALETAAQLGDIAQIDTLLEIRDTLLTQLEAVPFDEAWRPQLTQLQSIDDRTVIALAQARQEAVREMVDQRGAQSASAQYRRSSGVGTSLELTG